MSSFNARPSILMRKPKVPSVHATLTGSEHLDMEYDREQARLAAKRDARVAREHHRGQQLWGSAADKQQLALEERRQHDALLEARRHQQQAEADANARLAAEADAREHDRRRAEQAKLDAKREYLARLRDDNHRLAEQRRATAAFQREEDKAVHASAAGAGFLDKFGRHAY